MSNYLPPTSNVPIFDTLNFNAGSEALTYDIAKKNFLTFPTAQGNETLLDITVGGTATFLGAVSVNGTLTLNGNVVYAEDIIIANNKKIIGTSTTANITNQFLSLDDSANKTTLQYGTGGLYINKNDGTQILNIDNTGLTTASNSIILATQKYFGSTTSGSNAYFVFNNGSNISTFFYAPSGYYIKRNDGVLICSFDSVGNMGLTANLNQAGNITLTGSFTQSGNYTMTGTNMTLTGATLDLDNGKAVRGKDTSASFSTNMVPCTSTNYSQIKCGSNGLVIYNNAGTYSGTVNSSMQLSFGSALFMGIPSSSGGYIRSRGYSGVGCYIDMITDTSTNATYDIRLQVQGGSSGTPGQGLLKLSQSTPAASDNSATVATTGWVQSAITASVSTSLTPDSITITSSPLSGNTGITNYYGSGGRKSVIGTTGSAIAAWGGDYFTSPIRLTFNTGSTPTTTIVVIKLDHYYNSSTASGNYTNYMTFFPNRLTQGNQGSASIIYNINGDINGSSAFTYTNATYSPNGRQYTTYRDNGVGVGTPYGVMSMTNTYVDIYMKVWGTGTNELYSFTATIVDALDAKLHSEACYLS